MATQLANRTTGAVSDELIERAHQRADAAREPRRHAAESSSPPATASRSRTQSESSARRWEHATSRARASSPRSSTTGSRTSRPIRSRTTSPVPAEPTQRDVWFADLDPRRARPCERSPSSPSAKPTSSPAKPPGSATTRSPPRPATRGGPSTASSAAPGHRSAKPGARPERSRLLGMCKSSPTTAWRWRAPPESGSRRRSTISPVATRSGGSWRFPPPDASSNYR